MSERSRHDICKGCPVYEATVARGRPGGEYVPGGTRTGATRLIVYGESAGSEEALVGQGFVGRSGRLLRWAETCAGLSVPTPQVMASSRGYGAVALEAGGDVVHANVIACHPPGNVWPGNEVAQDCLQRHASYHQDLVSSKLPILLCGDNATRSLTGYSLGIVETCGSWLPVQVQEESSWAVSTLHPAFLVRGSDQEDEKGQEHLKPLLIRSIERALEATGPITPKSHIVSGYELLETCRTYLSGEGPYFVSLDIEGIGTPTLVGVAWEATEAWAAWWDPSVREAVRWLTTQPNIRLVLHNAGFDLPELLENGVPLPPLWVDTIVTAGLLNPDLPLGLQSQSLAFVPGSVAWKGLVTHKDPTQETSENLRYRALHAQALAAQGRTYPNDWMEWYAYYNAIDVCYTLQLARKHKEALGHRARYYAELLQPLQRPLLAIGRGMPVDPVRRDWWRRRADRVILAAKRSIDTRAEEMLQARAREWQQRVEQLEGQREQERVLLGKRGKFSKADELTKARTKWRARTEAIDAGFNVDSAPQKIALLEEYYGLPLAAGRKTKGKTTDEKALSKLLLRLESGALRPKKGKSPREAKQVLRAMIQGKQWLTWKRGYLMTNLVGGSREPSSG